MEAIRSYSTRLEADLARIALEGADIPATVVGVDVAFGGIGGVQLLVPEDRVEAAEKVLKEREEGDERASVTV
jgi:Putative prokaryotic signal transducing protein